LTENGPFTWEAGTLAPTQNSYAWNNLTNVLWVEQPVGVGYSQGTPNITNEVELGIQFRGFYKNFVDTFDLKNSRVYVTGESYAGFYVPYIADSFIEANDLEYFNLAGISINDPIIGDETIQQQVVILPFVEYWQNLLYLNETFMDQVRERQQQCNYSSYLDEYFQFPPPQKAFPVLPDPYSTEEGTCDMFDTFYNAILEVNPCFNIYHVTETCRWI
jgi:carboxypeptidase D